MIAMIMLIKIVILISVVCVLDILVHEAGHYCMAQLIGLSPDQFVIGRGPAIYSKGKLRLHLIPIWGMVYFADNRLGNTKPYQRRLVALAGPATNIILGILLINISDSALFGFFGLFLLMTGVGNLIPIKIAKIRTDGHWAIS